MMNRVKAKALSERQLTPAHGSTQGKIESCRYCSKCLTFKPERSHHCRNCNYCVLKMDHHCPWINNCVGFNNQKHFVLFVGHTCFGASLSLVYYTIRLVQIVSQMPTTMPRNNVVSVSRDDLPPEAVFGDDSSSMRQSLVVLQLSLIIVNIAFLLFIAFGKRSKVAKRLVVQNFEKS